ncbi:hypothetical protein N0V88_001205 [Collariella sp. IMI 366227]|nr:hypothetical protein N0V88_001205 [Collariella sp. IMI 366227]
MTRAPSTMNSPESWPTDLIYSGSEGSDWLRQMLHVVSFHWQLPQQYRVPRLVHYKDAKPPWGHKYVVDTMVKEGDPEPLYLRYERTWDDSMFPGDSSFFKPRRGKVLQALSEGESKDLEHGHKAGKLCIFTGYSTAYYMVRDAQKAGWMEDLVDAVRAMEQQNASRAERKRALAPDEI